MYINYISVGVIPPGIGFEGKMIWIIIFVQENPEELAKLGKC